ncbi:MAG: CDP-alcohol phosphatidyltransferase family protein [Clostridiales bacterium]|nr:CDP-alcohol phosphatidyltransferase family protein [Candidatus Blautia equi]
MIGFYDYTVVLTYISLFSALYGMYLASCGNVHMAIFCLALSGLLDTFDGKVARTKKDRTEDEKNFGIQIDSLCDVICFGVLPVVICFHSGMGSILERLILGVYCLCGLIRLAYFNVMETKRQQETSENRKYYQGLPITSIAVILPVTFMCSAFLQTAFEPVLSCVMLLTGFLFVKRFNFRKPTNKEIAVLIVLVGTVVLFIVLNYRWGGIFKWNWGSMAESFE